MSDDTTIYDVFSGAGDHDAVWLCSVEGLRSAQQRMEEIAKVKPGSYFVYYLPERTVVARTNTARKGNVA